MDISLKIGFYLCRVQLINGAIHLHVGSIAHPFYLGALFHSGENPSGKTIFTIDEAFHHGTIDEQMQSQLT